MRFGKRKIIGIIMNVCRKDVIEMQTKLSGNAYLQMPISTNISDIFIEKLQYKITNGPKIL